MAFTGISTRPLRTMRVLTLAVIFCMVLLSMSVCATDSRPLIGYNLAVTGGTGWLHTEGAKILDEQGMVFVPKGAAVMELAYQRSLYQPAGQILSEMKSFGANTVRLAVNSAFWSTDPNYRAVVDEFVQTASQDGIYVMIDLHNTLARPQDYNDTIVYSDIKNPDNMINFLADVAQTYKDNPYVLYSVLGQPLHEPVYFTNENDVLWWNVALRMVRAIHQVNPKALIFVPSLDANSIREYDVDNPWPEPNIVYALHRYYHYDGSEQYAELYSQSNFTAARQAMEDLYEQIGLRVLSEGYSLSLIEFGATTQDPNWDRQITDLYSLLRNYGVGWLQWVWFTPGGSPFALLLPDYTLSPQGQLWARELGWQLTSTSATTTTNTTSIMPVSELVQPVLFAAVGISVIALLGAGQRAMRKRPHD
jgi:hypothetical protein